ncbi:MAG TPA: hypothetical protein VF991_08285, partial [Reyranella sp.]
ICLEPNGLVIVLGMIPIGIGVGLTFPTLMAVGTSGLPPSSFATGVNGGQNPRKSGGRVG